MTFKWDGKSRPSDDKYRKRWDEIFKKEKTLHEELMEGFEKEQKELNESYKQSLKNKVEREDVINSIVNAEKKSGKDLVSLIIDRKRKELNDKKK
tara:strand:+ start:214 stop:498 length:285 start_codon:yes stop_codon:yes gene_type:complete